MDENRFIYFISVTVIIVIIHILFSARLSVSSTNRVGKILAVFKYYSIFANKIYSVVLNRYKRVVIKHYYIFIVKKKTNDFFLRIGIKFKNCKYYTIIFNGAFEMVVNGIFVRHLIENL